MEASTKTATYRPVRFTFADGPIFYGFADGTSWNGFANVWVTEQERERIAAWLGGGEASELFALPVDGWGLISLANGFACELEAD